MDNFDGPGADTPSAPRKRAAPRLREVPAVTRAVAILRLLAARPNLPLSVVARELGLVQSTCLHILRVLVAEGLVQVDAAKQYALGVGMVALARAARQATAFPVLAQPALDRVSAAWGVTALGVAIAGLEHMVVLAMSHSPSPLRLHVDIGSRFPALISATGRLVAAFSKAAPAAVEARFAALRWDRPPGLAAWRRDVLSARRQGYSIDRGNYIAGVAVVSVPVLDGAGRMTHALVALAMDEALGERRGRLLARDLRSEADALTPRLAPQR
ncbi:MAG: helix-turn-helix domain-containing protein [Burkholderiaceae bacterium]|nr:helix-turn-helix domain-containing protein [Burkholderiaceae bacterium]